MAWRRAGEQHRRRQGRLGRTALQSRHRAQAVGGDSLRGRCADCGCQTHEVQFDPAGSGRSIKIPLSVPGEVHRGRCLFCHPLPSSHSNRRSSNNNNNQQQGQQQTSQPIQQQSWAAVNKPEPQQQQQQPQQRWGQPESQKSVEKANESPNSMTQPESPMQQQQPPQNPIATTKAVRNATPRTISLPVPTNGSIAK